MDALSASTRALLNAAKSDAPQAAARAQMWGAVSTATGIAAAAAKGAAGTGVAAATGAVTAASGKLLVVGALLGSALTAGFGYALVHGARIEHRVDAVSASGDAKHESVESAKNAPLPRSEFSGEVSTPPVEIDSYNLDVSRKGVPDKGAAVGVVAPRVASAPVPRAGHGDSLGREAALVAEASSAVRRGDAEAALASLDAVRRIGSHRMEPEELSIRVRALRYLGRDAEATETEAALRTKYPDHFLAR
jgi:hypothetical protein